MYLEHYGLKEPPFSITPDPRFVFLSERHRDALAHLLFGIGQGGGGGFVQLTGEVGTGKTTLVRAALAQADASSLCVHVTNPRLTRDEFFQLLAEGFKLDRAVGTSKVTCLAALEERLVARLNRREHSTLIIDEVQSVSDEVLEEIRLLTNMELNDGTRLLSIVMVGQPEFGARLNTPELRHLKQRVSLRCELRALTLQETAGFIASRIRVAGGTAAGVFTREAVQLIHEVSGGIPRVISVLCDNALVTGFAENKKPVGSKLVQDVCRDFHIECREDLRDELTAAPAAGAATAPAMPVDAAAARPGEPAAHEPAAVGAQVPAPLFSEVANTRRRFFGIF